MAIFLISIEFDSSIQKTHNCKTHVVGQKEVGGKCSTSMEGRPDCTVRIPLSILFAVSLSCKN